MKTTKLLLGITFISLIGLFYSCEKNLVTIGEVNAKKIQDIIEQRNPKVAKVYEYAWIANDSIYDWNPVKSSEEFEIEDTFLKVDQEYYSLENLYSFEIVEPTWYMEKTLKIFFSH